MGTIAITGSASGIGKATRELLEARGHRVVGIDLRDSEVITDLSTAGGRRLMPREVDDLCDGSLDGLVVAAGVMGQDPAQVVSVNYFGAIAALEGVHPYLQASGDASVVVIASNSATTHPATPLEVAEWCLAGEETRARQIAADHDVSGVYAASKLALGLWMRRHAATDEWMGSGVRLNAIAPGFVDTPLTAGGWDFVASLGDTYPMPAGRPAQSGEVANLIGYLMSPEASYFCGSYICMDGGTEAALRPDAWPRPVDH